MKNKHHFDNDLDLQTIEFYGIDAKKLHYVKRQVKRDKKPLRKLQDEKPEN